MRIRDVSLFVSFLFIVPAPLTLKWKTNLHSIDLLIMQNETKVRLRLFSSWLVFSFKVDWMIFTLLVYGALRGVSEVFGLGLRKVV